MWTTKLTKRHGWPCQVPIVGAPMANHAGGELGGLGFIGAGHLLCSQQGLEKLHQEINLVQQQDDLPLCLGFICHSTFRDKKACMRFEQLMERYRPSVVQFFTPAVAGNNIERAQSSGAKVLAQVGSYREALEAIEAGADGLIVQGSEAGGHGLRRELGNATFPLARAVLEKVPITMPVIAAGGIVDGRTMAAALTLGCDGVVLGTRLWASFESMGKQAYKDRLVEANSCDDVVRTTTFDAIMNTYSKTPWPEPFDSVGALRNKTSNQESRELTDEIVQEYRHAEKEGNADIALVHAGEGVGQIDAIEPAEDLVRRISEEAADVIRRAPTRLLGGT